MSSLLSKEEEIARCAFYRSRNNVREKSTQVCTCMPEYCPKNPYPTFPGHVCLFYLKTL